MNHICYYIGGPMDMVKGVKKDLVKELFCLDIPDMVPINKIADALALENAQVILNTRHVYELAAQIPVADHNEKVNIYRYVGYEVRSPDSLTFVRRRQK